MRYTQRVPAYVYGLIVVGWIVWMMPFFLIRRGKGGSRQTLPQIDRRARWGIVLQAIAYAILWQNSFWTRTLGKQWRFDAGLNADHELVQSGAYRFVRHPIYTSMLCIMIGTGALITPVSVLVLAVGLFAIGTEIRVRIEDALLASRFGDRFDAYRARVAAYIPFVY